MAIEHFWAFLDPNSSKYGPALLKFVPQLLLKESKRLFQKIFIKIESFQSLHFLLVFVQLWGHFSPWRRPKSKKLKILWTKLHHRAIQKSQNQGPILSQFFRKNTITFCPLLAIVWWKKGCGNTLKAWNQNLTWPIAVSQFWGIFQYKQSQHILVLSLFVTKVFFF